MFCDVLCDLEREGVKTAVSHHYNRITFNRPLNQVVLIRLLITEYYGVLWRLGVFKPSEEAVWTEFFQFSKGKCEEEDFFAGERILCERKTAVYILCTFPRISWTEIPINYEKMDMMVWTFDWRVMHTRISAFFFSNPRSNPRTRMPPFVCLKRSQEEHLQSAREQT